MKRTWIQADLSQREVSERIASAISNTPVGCSDLQRGRSGEGSAFSPRYDVTTVSDEENERVITVNLTSAINCLSKLLPNLRQSANAKVILIGSINGLENTRMPEVAYSASKFGLRGVAHALREGWRQHKIAVTCINPGSIGDLPASDLVEIVKCLMRLTNRTCVKEIDVPAMSDENV
ncbi:MAG: SDR family oxidoreductase [Anaerolineae bacterium]|nr:SDR family oxidoreductase [Anaerolineae bacterium]